jgi:TonB family protein
MLPASVMSLVLMESRSIMLLALSTMIGCTTMSSAATPTRLTTATRFPSPENIDVAFDSATGPRPAPCRSNCTAKYPAGPRSKGTEADVVVAFVVDSSGRAEVPSASFIQDAAEPEFRQAICAYLRDARFVYPRGIQPRRALVVMPVQFTINRRAVPLDVKSIERELRQMPRSQVFEQLAASNHCL